MIDFNTVENHLAKDDERNYTAVVQHQEPPTELLFQLPTLTPGTYWQELMTQSSGQAASNW